MNPWWLLGSCWLASNAKQQVLKTKKVKSCPKTRTTQEKNKQTGGEKNTQYNMYSCIHLVVFAGIELWFFRPPNCQSTSPLPPPISSSLISSLLRERICQSGPPMTTHTAGIWVKRILYQKITWWRQQIGILYSKTEAQPSNSYSVRADQKAGPYWTTHKLQRAFQALMDTKQEALDTGTNHRISQVPKTA